MKKRTQTRKQVRCLLLWSRNIIQEVLHSDAVSTVEEYAVWGGVPRYWELRLQDDGLQESIAYNTETEATS